MIFLTYFCECVWIKKFTHHVSIPTSRRLLHYICYVIQRCIAYRQRVIRHKEESPFASCYVAKTVPWHAAAAGEKVHSSFCKAFQPFCCLTKKRNFNHHTGSGSQRKAWMSTRDSLHLKQERRRQGNQDTTILLAAAYITKPEYQLGLHSTFIFKLWWAVL